MSRNFELDKRRKERRNLCIMLLGNECVECKTKEKLEFDHIHKESKQYGIHELLRSDDTDINDVLDELVKCQLLCFDCHLKKHDMIRIREHGGGSQGIPGCKCFKCKEKRSQYDRNRPPRTDRIYVRKS